MRVLFIVSDTFIAGPLALIISVNVSANQNMHKCIVPEDGLGFKQHFHTIAMIKEVLTASFIQPFP